MDSPPPSTEPIVRAAALVAPIAAGLGASSMLLVDYLRPAPLFCEEGGGCDLLKHTSFAHALGAPTPVFGVVGFFVLAALAVGRGAWARRALAVAALAGALVGVGLVGVQAWLGVFCPYCVTVDASAIVVAVVAVVRVRGGWDMPASGPAFVGSAAVWLIAVLLPVAIGKVTKVNVPPEIAAELAQTPPGKVTIIDFADYECPYCRENHQDLEPLVEAHKGELRVVRKNVPLAMHPHAMDAARAACCGARLGKDEAMANALFSAPVADLTPEGCEKIAAGLGVSVDAYRACVVDPSTEASIHADTEMFRAIKAHGLPTVWIGTTKIEGAMGPEALKEALDAALAHAGS